MAAADGLDFDTVYLGGGTPSALAPDQLAEILGAVRARLRIREDAWTFLEINPEDVSSASVRAWRELGVRTVSLGVQSFDDAALAFLGRRHTADDARAEPVERLREGGFDTVSVDLIYGLPGQTADGWRRQLEEAAARSADHLSCYQLTIHHGTVFGRRQARGELAEAAEPVQAELFLLTHRVLAELGYEGYEVSNFAAAPAPPLAPQPQVLEPPALPRPRPLGALLRRPPPLLEPPHAAGLAARGGRWLPARWTGSRSSATPSSPSRR